MWLLCGERHHKSAAACSLAGQRRSVVVGAGPNWTLCHLGSIVDGPSAGPATAVRPPSSDLLISVEVCFVTNYMVNFGEDPMRC